LNYFRRLSRNLSNLQSFAFRRSRNNPRRCTGIFSTFLNLYRLFRKSLLNDQLGR